MGPEGVHVFEVDWDGERAVAICADEPTESAWYGAYVALLDLDARTAERVYEPEWQIQCPVLAGDSVWFVEGFCSDRGVLAGDVKVVDLDRRDVRDIAVENTDVSFLAQRDDDRSGSPGCAGSAARAAPFPRARWRSSGGRRRGRRPLQPYVAAGGDRLLSIFESPDRAPEVVEFDDGDWRALSELNGAIPDPNAAGTWEARTWRRPTASRSKACCSFRTRARRRIRSSSASTAGRRAPGAGASFRPARPGRCSRRRATPSCSRTRAEAPAAARSSPARTSGTWAGATSRTSSPGWTRSWRRASSTPNASASTAGATAGSCQRGR